MDESQRDEALISLMGQTTALQLCIKHLLAEHFRHQPDPRAAADHFFETHSLGAGIADSQESRPPAKALYERAHATLAVLRQQVREQLQR